MALDTYTLRNATNTITAVIRYPTDETAYPLIEKTFTKQRLVSGNYIYDYPVFAEKRTWNLRVIREDAGDDLLNNLKQLHDLKEVLYLDENALIIENNIEVVFEEFQPIFRLPNQYDYVVVLQER